MRNRVAHDGARVTRGMVARGVRVTAVLTVLPVALFVAGAQVASADSGVVEGRLSFGVGGIVGFAAVLIGVGGLLAGLLRRRRIAAARAAEVLAARQTTKPVPARSETAA